MKKTLILTDNLYEDLKQFDPEHYQILANYIWWYFNVSGKYYCILTKTTRTDKHKEISQFTICKSQLVSDYSRPFTPNDVASKPLTVLNLIKNCEYTYAICIILGFLIGLATCMV